MSLGQSIENMFYSGFQIKTDTKTIDAGGAVIHTWSNGATFNGHIRKLSSSEIIDNAKRGVSSSHRLYCSASTSLTKLNRVTFDSKEYHVTHVDNVHELDEFLQVELLFDEVQG